MKRESITLEHQELLVKRFTELNVTLSECSFPNVYLFQKTHSYQILFGEEVYISGIHRDFSPYIMLTVPFTGITAELESLLKQVSFIYPIPDEWLSKFPKDIFTATYQEADSDYIFSSEKLRSYPGRNLSSKRNLVRQFLDKYSWEGKVLSQETVADAKAILEEWKQSREEEGTADYYACKEALSIWNDIREIEGRIYYTEGKPIGFIIGSNLSNTCHVIHFLKGIKDYKGIYQFLYQDYVCHLNERIKYVNLEQDLGNPQLRQAKHSYEPDFLCKKWRLKLNSA